MANGFSNDEKTSDNILSVAVPIALFIGILIFDYSIWIPFLALIVLRLLISKKSKKEIMLSKIMEKEMKLNKKYQK